MGWSLCQGGNGSSGGGTPYLMSNGSQYIELPVYSDDGLRIEFDMMNIITSNGNVIIGDLFSTSGVLIYTTNSVNQMRISPSVDASFPKINNKSAHLVIDYVAGTLTVDGTVITTSPSTHQHLPVFLFGLSGSRLSSVVLGEIKIYVNDVLTMDLVPTKDPTTGVGYYHDSIGGSDYFSDTSTDLIYILMED